MSFSLQLHSVSLVVFVFKRAELTARVGTGSSASLCPCSRLNGSGLASTRQPLEKRSVWRRTVAPSCQQKLEMLGKLHAVGRS
jgi:hypothetical protein